MGGISFLNLKKLEIMKSGTEINPKFFEQDDFFIFDRMNTVYNRLQRHCLVLDIRDLIDWHIVYQARNQWKIHELN